MKKILVTFMCLMIAFGCMACGNTASETDGNTASETDGSLKYKGKPLVIEEVDTDDYAFKIRVSKLGKLDTDKYGMSILIWDGYGLNENNTCTIDNIIVNGISLNDNYENNIMCNEEKNLGMEDGWIQGPAFEWSKDDFGGEIETVSFHINISSENTTYLDKDYTIEN